MERGDARPRWPLGSAGQIAHAVALSLAVVSHFIVGFAIVAPALGLRHDEVFGGSGRALLMTAAQGVWAWGVVIGLGLLRLGRLSLRDLGWRLDALAREVPLGVLGALGLVVVMLGPSVVTHRASVGELLSGIGGFTAGQRAEIVLIGLLAASIEETVFRGYLQPGLVARLGFAKGLAVGALVFGLYHLPMGLPAHAIVTKIASGFVLGALRGRDRSLVPSATAHFLFWQLVGFT